VCAGKLAAGALGLLFCGVQLAASQDYITVNWPKIQRDVSRVLEASDGKAVKATQERVTNVLAYNVPSAQGAGFMSGLAFALSGRIGKLAILTGTAALAAPLAFNDSDGEFHDMVTSHLPLAAEAFQSVLVRAMAYAEAARWQDATPAQLAKEEASLRKELKAAAAGQDALRLKARLRALEEARRAPRQ
jgi:hypothetical protein